MKDDYFKKALETVGDPNTLINMVWGRVRMIRSGNPPLVESPEEHAIEDIALREIIEGRITCVLDEIVVLDSIAGLPDAVTPTQ